MEPPRASAGPSGKEEEGPLLPDLDGRGALPSPSPSPSAPRAFLVSTRAGALQQDGATLLELRRRPEPSSGTTNGAVPPGGARPLLRRSYPQRIESPGPCSTRSSSPQIEPPGANRTCPARRWGANRTCPAWQASPPWRWSRRRRRAERDDWNHNGPLQSKRAPGRIQTCGHFLSIRRVPGTLSPSAPHSFHSFHFISFLFFSFLPSHALARRET
jgi:hypothetical protein